MATRTIVGKVYNLLDQPVQGAKLKFILNLSTFTADKEYQSSFTETITDAFGNWAVNLWVNSESLSVTSYTCVDVDDSRFIFTIDPGITPLTYSQIKALGAPINSPPSSLLGLISTQIATKADQTALTNGLSLKADQTALISALATKVNSTDLTTALLLKADQTALTNGLTLKADTTALTSGLALKANATESIRLDNAIALKADQTALTSGLALKANNNFLNGRGSINVKQSANQNMYGAYTYDKLNFGNVVQDTLNEWNVANSFYTATYAGLYLVMIGMDSNNGTSRKFLTMMNYLTSTEIITLFDIQSGTRAIATSMFYWTANTQVYFVNQCSDTFDTIGSGTFLKIERIL